MITPPPRVAQPPRAETVQTLQFTASIMSGYDRNLVPPNLPQGVPPAQGLSVRNSSYTGLADASLAYSLASGGRSLNVTGGGSATRYTNVGGNDGPVYAARAIANFQTPLGDKTNVTLSQTATRVPYISMGLFSNPRSAPTVAYDADGNPLNGLISGYIWSTSSAIGLNQTLTRHTTGGIRYAYQTSRHEGTGNDLKYESHSAAVDLGQQITQITDVRASYRVSVRGAAQSGLQYDDLHHSFTVVVRRNQPLSRTRSLDIAAGGGADMIQPSSTHGRYWRPTYFARIGTDVGRSWSAAATYTQTENLLYSPLSAPDSYSTRSAVLSAGGNLSRGTGLVINGGVTQGGVPASHSITGTSGDFLGFTAGAQLQFDLVRSLSAVVGANYFRSELRGAANLLPQAASVFQRNSVRVGFHWSLPILDSSRQR